MDKKNRIGVNQAVKAAEELFYELARENISTEDIENWLSDCTTRGYLAHNAPDQAWEGIVGFIPDAVFYSQVTIGLAVDYGQTPDIFAKILICREKSHDFKKIIWCKRI